METAVLHLQDTSLEGISEHVKTYAGMSIPEMVYIDSQLEKGTNKEFNLLKLLDKIKEEETNPTSIAYLNRIYNNFELYKDIMGVSLAD